MLLGRALAVAQTCPHPGDVAANIREHLRLAELAAEQGAKTVLFPELSLTGYELQLGPALAFVENDSRLEPLLSVARARDVTLIVGAPVRWQSSLHIGALLIAPHGIDIYTKRRLGAFSADARCDSCDGLRFPPAEHSVFQPGDHNPLLPCGSRPAAVAICADVGNPDHPRSASERGAQTYLASMFVIPSEFAGEEAKLRRYATEHGMLIALSNYGGPTGGLRSAGRSSIWAESGDLLVQLPAHGSGIAMIKETANERTSLQLLSS